MNHKIKRTILVGMLYLIAIIFFISSLYIGKDVNINNFSSIPFILLGISILIALLGWGVYIRNLSPEEKRKREIKIAKKRAEAKVRKDIRMREEERRRRIRSRAYEEELGRQEARDRIKEVKRQRRVNEETFKGAMDFLIGRPPKRKIR